MKRVLVVDDDRAVRDSFDLALEGLPCTVVTADDGLRAVAIASTTPVDLVFLDLKMPGVDGVEALQRLRDVGCQAPVFIVTGFADEFVPRLRSATEAHLDYEVMRKPLGREEIRTVVTSILDEQQRGTPSSVQPIYVFTVYVTGDSSIGKRAAWNLNVFCKSRLKHHSEVRVIDILSNPSAAMAEGIIATPTVVKQSPLPRVRIFGDCNDLDRLWHQLGLPENEGE